MNSYIVQIPSITKSLVFLLVLILPFTLVKIKSGLC